MVRRLHVAAEIGAIDLDVLPSPPIRMPFISDAIASRILWASTKAVLYWHVEIAGQRQRRLALDLVAEDRDGREIVAQRQLVEGEQGAAGDAEVLAARLAAPARRTVGPAAS